jgi:hypothetical protein
MKKPKDKPELGDQLVFPSFHKAQDANENPIFDSENPKPEDEAPPGYKKHAATIALEYFVPEDVPWGEEQEDFVAGQAAAFTSNVITAMILGQRQRQAPVFDPNDKNIN